MSQHKTHPELLATLGTAKIVERQVRAVVQRLSDDAYKAQAAATEAIAKTSELARRIEVASNRLADALSIDDEAARADKAAPVLDELEALTRTAEGIQ